MDKPPIRPGLSGIKPYISGKPAEEVEKELGVRDVIKLASNENPLGPSPKALEAAQKNLRDLSLYPDQACFLLKEALAKKWDLSPDNFAVGNGSDEIMQLAAAAFLSAREEVILSQNTFSTYEFVTRLMDGDPVFIPLKSDAYDLDSMAAVVTPKTKLIFLCNPNNPTGTINTQEEIDSFLAKVPERVLVIIDEAYGEYAESKAYPKSTQYVGRKNVLVLRTFSKIYGLAGLRVGYGIGAPDLIKYLNLVKLPFNVNRLAQFAAAAALDDQEHIERSLKNNQAGKKYLYAELSKIKVKPIPTEANFIFMDLKIDTDILFVKMLREGVIVRPLASFGLPTAIRVTIGTPEQNRRFIDALKKALS